MCQRTILQLMHIYGWWFVVFDVKKHKCQFTEIPVQPKLSSPLFQYLICIFKKKFIQRLNVSMEGGEKKIKILVNSYLKMDVNLTLRFSPHLLTQPALPRGFLPWMVQVFLSALKVQLRQNDPLVLWFPLATSSPKTIIHYTVML